jgi:antitoxin StbD
MFKRIYGDMTISISELRKNPQTVFDAAKGRVIAVLNRNKPAAYIIPAGTYEKMMRNKERNRPPKQEKRLSLSGR